MSTSVSEVKHLIGTEWVPSSDGNTFESRDPHDGSLLATVARGTADDGRAAIAAARTAFDDGPWPQMSPKERAAILHAVADNVDEHRDEPACGTQFSVLCRLCRDGRQRGIPRR